jgi:hypothetical protein
MLSRGAAAENAESVHVNAEGGDDVAGGSGGPAMIVGTGTCVWITKLRVAGVGSMLPTSSFAITVNVWPPCPRLKL